MAEQQDTGGPAFDAGYDCGINGPSLANCSFRLFDSPSNTREWERGKAVAERRKREKD